MFSQIFLFEIRYRLRRPAFYVYFILLFGFSLFIFAKGAIGAPEKVVLNSPASLAEFLAATSIFLMLVSSAIMGTPLYRDLEHNTKEYYLSYPITKAGYFWGRYLGSFFFVLVIGLGILLGIRLGSLLGPVFGWQPAGRYGANRLLYYFYPYFTITVPTLFFTSSLFFGLVAAFRNVKVIYSSGLFLLLGYILANFFLHNINNQTIIFLADPFLLNGVHSAQSGLSPQQLNHNIIPLTGLILENRILWVSVGAIVLAITWWRFSFERFFSGRLTKDRRATRPAPALPAGLTPVHTQLQGSYYRRTLFSLTRIELLNIIRDNYFWLILTGGYIFLSFVFWNGPHHFGVKDFPRTVFFVDVFNDIFLVFVFLIIVFYTGETVHREKLTGFAFINDALPPPDWVLNSAKIVSLCCLAAFLSLTPALIGLPVQLLRGYTAVNIPVYFASTFVITFPKLVAMVLFCYAIQLIVNNKFAAYGVAITIYTAMLVVSEFNYFNYTPLLYSHIPFVWASDMDGIGHMTRPIGWFQFYWTAAGLVLIVIGSLFFARGVPRSLRERLRLASQRFHGPARIGFGALLALFLILGGYIYYNVSYLNEYLTPWEHNERNALVEKHLKQYAGMPLPRITRLSMTVDLFPGEQREETHATLTVMNKDHRPIDSLLIDGDGLDFDISHNGAILPYTCPLYFPAGKFNLFRPRKEPSDYRLYILPVPLQPGDSMQFQVHSNLAFPGFRNSLYAANALHNGMFTTGNLPGAGYDEGDEIGNNDIRKDHGLPEKHAIDIPWDDSTGRNTLAAGGDLISYDLTVSTSAGQWVQASGRLEKEWMQNGRHYFHFIQDNPGLYPPAAIATARYARWTDTVRLNDGRTIQVEIDYHPVHSANLRRYQTALKDGLRYFSRAFGPFPYDRLCLVESSAYSRNEISTPGVIFISEPDGWVADLRDRGDFDYPYYTAAVQLAHQWWGSTVIPNNTLGAPIINSGVPHYAALALLARRPDSTQVQRALDFLNWDYTWGHRTDHDGERPLINANKGYELDARAALQLYALGRSIGFDSLNTALRAFRDQWAFRKGGPYAGAHDLFNTLDAHIPDSLHTWLADAWQKTPTGPPTSPTTRPAPTARR
ncbi:ABC transporter permease/M1 family aminopeptidase [Puia dinghuensis]|uniref:Peptidase M1 membrane alanine aminopeptidase domain-containing protein n=1 Tax=Puia dinghuensis TaxID=1792502 RepID=A0A8J2UBY4_9BACT|nr:hypothetical protein [Puia dinghuensis]GGA94072.1 hypothetical protein GCM10011511_16730 [Puia dinghuensis]